jgi:hypothetical protein
MRIFFIRHGEATLPDPRRLAFATSFRAVPDDIEKTTGKRIGYPVSVQAVLINRA